MPLESIFCGLEAMKVEATTAPAAPLRLDAAEVTDSKADAQMALQTTDVRVVLQACDARVALASVGKLPEDARSLEVESDRQRRLDRTGRHRQLDSDLDFDFGLNSILDFDRDLDSARFHEGELALRKATAARDREAEHKGDRTLDHGGFGRGFDHVGHDNHGKLRGSKEWVPLTKLGRLVKTGMLCKVEEAYLHSLLIKEHQVLETLVPGHTAAHRELLEEHRELEVDQRRGGSRSAAAVGLR